MHDCAVLATRINMKLAVYFHGRNMKIFATQSTATLWNTWSAEMKTELNVQVEGKIIPTTNYPKILGSMFKSSAHATAICNKIKSRNKFLKALAGSTWGAHKETFLTPYKAIGRYVVSYADPMWSRNLSSTQWKNIQTCQNTVQKTATGRLLIKPMNLDEETKVFSVRQHKHTWIKLPHPDVSGGHTWYREGSNAERESL